MTRKTCGPVGARRSRLPHLMCSAAIALAVAFATPPGLAQTAQSQATEDWSSARAQARDFDIPAQPLTSALTAFGDQADMQVTVDTAILAGRTAPPVSGRMAPQEALRRLLAGTGITWRFADPTTLVLSRESGSEDGPARLEPITVDAVLPGTITDSYAAPDNFAATRTDTPTIDTPQSTQAITRQALEDAGATDVADAYDYLSGITREGNVGAIFGDAYLARGFVADNILINGNRSGRPTTLDTANVERVEALRGTTATLFGRADPGGLVNVVTKQPLAEPFYEAELQGGRGFFGDGSRYRDVRATVDTGGPIDEQGRLRYRFNAAAEYERSFRRDIDDKLFFVSPVVDFELDDKTVANLELAYQYREFVYDRGVPFIDGKPELPVDWYVGEDQAPNIDGHYLSGTFRVDRELTNALTARLGVYSSYNDVDGPGVEVASVNETLATAQANRFDFDISSLVVTVQPELVAEFAAGPVGHTVLFGVDASYGKFSSDIMVGARGSAFNIFVPGFPVDIPEIDLSQPGNIKSSGDTTARELGIYVQDQIDLSEQWKLLAGLRWDAVWLDAEQEVVPFFPRDKRNFEDTALLPRVGLVYQPIEEIGLFASYSETYRPPTGTNLVDANGDQVDPEEGRSVEVGIKLDALDGKVTGTLAAFRADKDNVITSDPNIPFTFVNLGKVRSQGVEFDLAGEVFENFSLGLSYAYTDAQIDSNDNPSLPKGTKLRNVPRHAASVQAAYRFMEGPLQGLRLFGGIVYEDDKQTNINSATVRTKIPDYLRFDVGASYDFTENIQARLFIQNLTDEEYYTSASNENSVFPGQPFNATLGVRVRF